jgi:hypothetical protein
MLHSSLLQLLINCNSLPSPLLRLHAYRDEAIAMLLLFVERQCMEANDATISESLFGLRRVKLKVRRKNGDFFVYMFL